MSVRLDKRLSEILSNVRGDTLADIGCDHGKLAAAAVLSGKVKKALACDISQKSLEKAKKLIDELGLREQIQCRAGDGLNAVSCGEADTVVIAGLGGDEIAKIICDAQMCGKRFLHYVLSPNTHAEKVRAAAVKQGFGIVRDYLVREGKKYYPVMVLSAREGKTRLSGDEIMFGSEFWKEDSFKEWAREEIAKLSAMIADKNAARLIKRYEDLKRACEKCALD
mgnify:CR=1 FL=1|jgi:tRNA (adenine22-N1)-methyltransferase